MVTLSSHPVLASLLSERDLCVLLCSLVLSNPLVVLISGSLILRSDPSLGIAGKATDGVVPIAADIN